MQVKFRKIRNQALAQIAYFASITTNRVRIAPWFTGPGSPLRDRQFKSFARWTLPLSRFPVCVVGDFNQRKYGRR